VPTGHTELHPDVPEPRDGWAVLEFAPDGMLVVDGSGTITFANSQAASLFRTSADALVGSSVEELVPEQLRGMHRAHRSGYRAHPEVRAMGVGLELRGRRADGSEFNAEISLSPVPGSDGLVVAAVRDITDRVAAEAELRRQREQLAVAERAVALSDDRERIARDLHDTVIQRIFAVGLSLQATFRITNDASRPRVERAIDDLDETIRELRSAIFSLSTPAPATGGLRGRITDAVTESVEGAGIEARVQFDGAVESLDARIAEQLVPVVREAVTNVVKHSSARNVRVAVTAASEVTVSVVDDGAGVRGEVVGGRGLANMSDRAAALGGTCALTAVEGGGSELRWTAPAAPPEGNSA
jgi:PAS domain S-box-containing protein